MFLEESSVAFNAFTVLYNHSFYQISNRFPMKILRKPKVVAVYFGVYTNESCVCTGLCVCKFRASCSPVCCLRFGFVLFFFISVFFYDTPENFPKHL